MGSIGVIMGSFGFTGAMEKLGIERRAYTAGENKDFLDPFAPENPAQREYAQKMLDEIHQQFIKVVRQGRGARLKESPEIFSGLVWSGEKSVELGLADGFGSLESVARDVIKAKKVVDFTPEDNVFETLSRRLGTSFGTAFGRAAAQSASAPLELRVGSAMSAVDGDPRIDIGLVHEAFDRSAVGLAIVTPEGVFRQVNLAFCAMIGCGREDLEGRSFRAITHPEDFARDEEHLRLIRAGREPPGTVDKRFLRRDGSEVWVRRSTAVLRDPSGEARFVIGAYIDLTEQRGKDRSLVKLNAFLTAIVENAPVAIYTTDEEGVVNFWNPAAERIFGYTREQAIGKPVPFIPESRREEARAMQVRAMAGEVLDAVQFEGVRADGAPIAIRGAMAPLRDEDDRPSGMLVACVDVTEARRAASELESHLHFTRALIDAIPSPVYFKDREGRYQVHNRAWGELFGGGVNWLGKTVFDMYDAGIAAQHHERDRALIERPSSATYELLMPTASGEKRQMLYNKVSFVDRRGEVAGLDRGRDRRHALQGDGTGARGERGALPGAHRELA